MKTAISVGLWVAMVSLSQAHAQVHNVWFEFPGTVNSNSVTVTLKADGEAPEWMAIIVQTNVPMREWQNAQRAAMEKWAAGFHEYGRMDARSYKFKSGRNF